MDPIDGEEILPPGQLEMVLKDTRSGVDYKKAQGTALSLLRSVEDQVKMYIWGRRIGPQHIEMMNEVSKRLKEIRDLLENS